MLLNLSPKFYQKLKSKSKENKEINYNLNTNFKYLVLIIIIYTLFFFKHIYINLKAKLRVEIDNKLDEIFYENNINFSNFSTEIKPIALYHQDFIDNYSNFNNYYDRNNLFESNNISIFQKIVKIINLAKSHGIYGFGIYYILDYQNHIYNKEVDIFLEVNFPFLLIWQNDNLFKQFENSESLTSIKIELNNFIKNIKKYLLSQKYIKINKRPVLSITKPQIFININETLLILREIARKNEIGEIFILLPFYKMLNYSSINMFDALYDLSQRDLLDNEKQISYYSGIIYRNIYLNQIDNFLIFRTSKIEINNYLINNKIQDFTQEKYYILNKVIIEWTKENYNKTKGFIFINAWNNYKNGNYLEPDEKFGFGSINSFSKALFNLPLKENNFNNSILDTKSFIAVQAHIYYEELIFEIINKTNNIPKFDLYITTMSLSNKNEIEKKIRRFSKAYYYEIKIVENKGRDILPLIIQMKKKIKNYKYFCHIHTKKSKHDINLGGNWRNYLYENLLGSKEIVSQILNDFENIEKLGFIFPEVYYDIIKNVNDYESIDFPLHRPNIYYMNFILKKIAPGFEIGNKLVFPTGDMFWAKVNAVHQIFKINFIKKFPKELNQTNETIMHGIERIWLYLVKINGYFYKSIFKHY